MNLNNEAETIAYYAYFFRPRPSDLGFLFTPKGTRGLTNVAAVPQFSPLEVVTSVWGGADAGAVALNPGGVLLIEAFDVVPEHEYLAQEELEECVTGAAWIGL